MPTRPLSFVVLSAFLTGCSLTGDPLPSRPGLAVAEGDASVAVSFDRLVDALEAAAPVGIVAEVDHQANAASAGLVLPPTRVVLFGNPALGTPLMQANPQAGLDLPQKVLVYEDDGRTVVAYNTVGYLRARHGVGNAGTLPQIERALLTFASTAAAADESVTVEAGSPGVSRDEGVVTVASGDDVATTYGRLRAAVDGNPNLTIVAEVDHQANATSVDLVLPPIRLIVFGNPALGTPLMQAGRTVAIDLPQKMLVYEDATGDVFVAYNDPGFLADRHDLGDPEAVETIRGALSALASSATGG